MKKRNKTWNLNHKKCALKVIAFTSPTQYTKSGKYMIESQLRLLSEMSISHELVFFAEAIEGLLLPVFAQAWERKLEDVIPYCLQVVGLLLDMTEQKLRVSTQFSIS